MKSVLVYYPFPLSENANSGSKLRPLEMKKAFHTWGTENGVNIIVISGTSDQRDQQFQQLLSSGKLDNLWFCYMENQTIPLAYRSRAQTQKAIYRSENPALPQAAKCASRGFLSGCVLEI